MNFCVNESSNILNDLCTFHFKETNHTHKRVQKSQHVSQEQLSVETKYIHLLFCLSLKRRGRVLRQ